MPGYEAVMMALRIRERIRHPRLQRIACPTRREILTRTINQQPIYHQLLRQARGA